MTEPCSKCGAPSRPMLGDYLPVCRPCFDKLMSVISQRFEIHGAETFCWKCEVAPTSLQLFNDYGIGIPVCEPCLNALMVVISQQQAARHPEKQRKLQ